MKFWDEIIKDEIIQQIGSVRVDSFRQKTYTLKEGIKKDVEAIAHSIAIKKIEETILEKIQKILVNISQAYIEEVVQTRLTSHINNMVDTEVKRRLEAAKNA